MRNLVMSRSRLVRASGSLLLGVTFLPAIGLQAAEPLRIGFLAAESSLDAMGPHNRAAWETSAELGTATLLLRRTNGSFADTNGAACALQEFDVVWYHQGDAIRRTGIYRDPSLAAVHDYATDGRGVLLSGGALAMVAQLRLETEIRPQRHDLGNYREPAGMVPVETDHPAFEGLTANKGTVWLSRGGCRAVADFYWGGPGEGMILAKTPTGHENPLVEYRLGKGRLVVFGWHWPDYADKQSPHRGNLVRLTTNLLGYLADSTAWQPFVIRSDYPPATSPGKPGISPARRRALRLAIDDLATTFGDRFIGDLDLHYDVERLLMSMPDRKGRWTVAELSLTNRTLRTLPLIDEPDVHNYDACYLPDDRIVFTSTAPFTGVPCVNGTSRVGNLYLRDHGGCIRRLTHDQDHNWCPTVLNNGRILYQRWEYADIAHAFTRLLFHANPDGSGQMEYYGSNSFWPTAMFFARPVPGHPTKVVTVVGGHHDAPRQGDLVILDPARGRFETEGVVQRIPGYGKTVEPVILDGLIGSRWPRFLHPYPLSEHYFIVSCKPTHTSLWGVYLVDVFDNFVRLAEEPGYALLEPVPLRPAPRPTVVPDRVEPERRDATVLMLDVYRGPGLRGVPRGAVKALRLFSYEFTFHGFGGEPYRVGFDGPWDVKRILGTVPVESDGSAHFRIPACTPLAIQPLDAEGKALALMRSWLTAVPGETLSCVGCHEPQNSTPPAELAPTAVKRKPSEITPWYGPARGFSFVREVQPVLDAYCTACHPGKPLPNGLTIFDLTARPPQRVPSAFQMRFTPSYVALRRFVHGHTLEGDAHLLPARAFHADIEQALRSPAPQARPASRVNTMPAQPETRRVSLGQGVELELVRIPPGEFHMGSDNGHPNERPVRRVAIESAFWIGRFEVSNGEYACFDPSHDSGLETGEQYAFGDYERGHLLNRPDQPVVRVSWKQAVAFCRWLSYRTGEAFTLPTEAQWEYACRAGTATPLWYGTLDDDFSRAANLSDATHHTVDYPHVPTALPPWRPADTRFDDGWRVSAPAGSFESNPWGLHDMHGNVAEWTLSPYVPCPYRDGGRSRHRVVRGGSWLDRPRRARASFRLHYDASQAVHDVGFRVACAD